MKNHNNPYGAPIGPKGGWAEWRAKKDRALPQPRRNKAAQKLSNSERAESKSRGGI